jgi:AhpD family alkylhydroperoxidase
MTTNTTSTADSIEPRMTNPAFVIPDGFKGIGHLLAAVGKGGVPTKTLELVGLRGSQINGCSACVQGHLEAAKKAGETDERIVGVTAWRESPYFDAAERAALELTEALTRLADRSDDPVPDELWREVVKQFDEQQVSALILQIATLNLFNRVDIAVKERADRPSWKQAA